MLYFYPLNALIGSQRKRMHAWSALDGVRYALLTEVLQIHQISRIIKRHYLN